MSSPSSSRMWTVWDICYYCLREMLCPICQAKSDHARQSRSILHKGSYDIRECICCCNISDIRYGGDGLQIWRVAANILNKQSQTANKGWSYSLGVGVGLTTPHREKISLLWKFIRSLGPGQILWINTEGVWKQGAEENIWTEESWSDRRLDKTA
jgi:hypothetical protein